MAQKKQEMSLEEFEDKRGGGSEAGQGTVQRWLRELEPLTPTRYLLNGRSAKSMASNMNGSWRGNSLNRVTSMRDEKGGGKLKTTIVGDELWVVWYPEEKNGA